MKKQKKEKKKNTGNCKALCVSRKCNKMIKDDINESIYIETNDNTLHDLKQFQVFLSPFL